MINGKNHTDLSTKPRTLEKRSIFFAGMFESQCKNSLDVGAKNENLAIFARAFRRPGMSTFFNHPRPVTDCIRKSCVIQVVTSLALTGLYFVVSGTYPQTDG